jgi:DNA-binding PucR family transcriptional regulator
MASCWRVRGQRQIGIVAREHVTAAQLAQTLGPHVVGRAGISPPTAYLGGVAELVRLAELALLTVTPDRSEIVLFDENMVGALIVSAPDVARRLADRVLSPLLALEPASRTILIETLRAFFEADGSVAVAAERLFCHRNTVLNRVRRVEGLTGLDLARPLDVTTLIVVLESLRLLPPPADEV